MILDRRRILMLEKELTNRQIQALNTKNKIYSTTFELIKSQGLQNVTVEAICRNANVSVGSFYNSYKSKNDILIDIYRRADDYFLNTIEKALQEGSFPDRILLFFDYYAKYNMSNGLDFVKKFYSTENKLFIKDGRHMPAVLQNIIEEGQKSGKISTKMTSEKIAEYLFIAARGVCFDWCLHDGQYDLDKLMADYIKNLITIFVP
jgi:TetR/AcrR family transcriptional regulator, fatty acid metabolism regulator protein